MRATTGEYYQSLDHVRALAAFTVFVWHFNSIHGGMSAPPLAFPLSLFTEGHTGVAIFMTLSGYLFAKLLSDRTIVFSKFLWNRFVRLVPLLVFALCLDGLQRFVMGSLDADFFRSLATGFVLPTLPVGGWSITVEAHFYLILPFLLYLSRRNRSLLLIVLAVSMLVRLAVYLAAGEVQTLAYWTIVGRIDQFVVGILFFQSRDLFDRIKARNTVFAAIMLSFLVFWYWFDSQGGFYKFPSYPSPSPVWIFIPLIEAVAYASLIVWYDTRVRHSDGVVARFVALIGICSYSIYLLHFFVVFRMAAVIDRFVISLSDPYLTLLVAVPSFMAFVPVAFVSYQLIERPFLRLRERYTSPRAA